jgi:hypothetical protein
VSKPIPPSLIKDLRHLVASAISDAKAYDVPGLCRRLGLADGTGEEAFSSKYRYARSGWPTYRRLTFSASVKRSSLKNRNMDWAR